ncbi:MAG: Ig-like domain-containing protein, partial [Actinomycetota bacterium]|nr:Ig-like domain-containing protein [Actinomycetota bacterium]
PGDPERDPVCATSYTQHVLYGAPANQASRYPEVVPQVQAIMRRANAVLNSESLESGGGEADYRMRCAADGEIKVDSFTGPAGDDSFGAVVDAATAAGFDEPGTKYTIFYETEATNYCGVGSLYDDERLSADNWNNVDTSYAVTHDGCWNGDTPMHENGHNMGAVQPGAPKSTGNGLHCYQERDVMCYSPDGGDRNQGGSVLDCAGHLHFDCGHDDYFDTAPEAGEYLASRWNIGSRVNRFLSFGGAAENAAPVARDDAAIAEKSVARGVVVLANDTDPDGDPVTITAVANPAHGSAAINPGTHSLRYTPDPGYRGADSFAYRISDGRGRQATATARMSVRDTVAPKVSAISPASRARKVPRSANAMVRFSEPMSAGTVNRTSVRLVRKGRTRAVRARVSYSGASRTVTLDPSAALARGATYTARVAGPRDPSGNALAPARSWSFTVRR